LGAAPEVGELLGACPGLKVLATSREPLHLRWEHEAPLGPLAVPDAGWPAGPADAAALEGLLGVPAGRLFVQRAQAARPGFRLAGGRGAAVAALCRRLDGLPLALELAAARTRVLEPPALLRRLVARLDLLHEAARDAPPRHQALREAIRWSYELLPV